MEQFPNREEQMQADIDRAQDDLEKLKNADDKESQELAEVLEQTVQSHLAEQEEKESEQEAA